MSLLSIIIPAFNSEKTLEKCVQSVLNQSYTCFEVILINDGSTDSTRKIGERFVDLDKRVTLINKVNEGVSAARNDGIKQSKGENIIFCDADDFMLPNALSSFIEFFDSDLVLDSYKCLPSNREEIFPDVFIEDLKYMGQFIKDNIFKGFSTPWAKMYKSDIIKENKIYFDTNICSGEDTLWVNEYLTYCNSLRSISFPVYQYEEDLGVLSKKGNSEEILKYSVDKVSSLVFSMEQRYKLDFEVFKKYQNLYFFQRFILFLSNCSFLNCYYALKRVREKRELLSLFKDSNNIINKGVRLRIFNKLMYTKNFCLATIIVKFTKRYV